ncbi:MAG: OmpA family protein [Phycisphaerales bacterium]|nr:OmpA family protein [Phycisphaerales bacterium]
MHRLVSIVLAAAGGFALLQMGGCQVPQNRYDELMTTNRSLQEQLVGIEDERDVLRNSLDMMRGQYQRATADLLTVQGDNDALRSSIGTLRDDYTGLLGRVSELELGGLPPMVSSALQTLAAQHADLMIFDAELGRIRFASDFTFASGSAALTDNARTTLRRLAEILNTPDARLLEARVVGHTDNVKPSKPATLRDHPTNTHLSVHRAISVRDVLVNAGVPAARIMVAGYGETRPIVPNGPNGAAQNRRVEIYLTPMAEQPPMMESGSTAPIPTTPAPTANAGGSRTDDFPPK